MDIVNMTNASATADIFSSGALEVEIEASCTLGTVTLNGTGNLTDNNGGTTVTQTNWVEVTQLEDANVELAAVPSTTASLREMFQWVFTIGRNRRNETGALWQVYKEDATTVLGSKVMSDDDTTFESGEAS